MPLPPPYQFVPDGCIPLGRRIDSDGDDILYVGEEAFHTHAAIFGGTGKGKSKFLENLLRHLILYGRGFCLIDPHGDLAEDLLAFLHRYRLEISPHLRRNTFYLEPAHQQYAFSYDPFAYRDADGDFPSWLHAKVFWAMQGIIRLQGEADTKGMARLDRWMKNVLYAAGVRVDKQGTHLPLADALLLLDPNQEHYDAVFERIAPHLPPDIRGNFESLRQGDRKTREEIESTENRLRSFFTSPRIQALFTQQAPAIDLRQIVRAGGLLIVNLKGLVPEEADALGGLIITDLFATVASIPKPERRRYFLFIDEATRFVGDDLVKGFGEARKWLLSICLAVQDLSSLRNSYVDMTARVISQCNFKISFQQENPQDLELLGKTYAYKELDRSRNVVEVDRPDGYTIDTMITVGNDERINGDQISRGRREGTNQVGVPKYRIEERDMGRKYSAAEQVENKMSDLAELGHREAIVAVASERPFSIYTPEVPDAWPTALASSRQQIIEGFKLRLFQSQSCYYPYDQVLDRDARVARFLHPPDTAVIGPERQANALLPYDDDPTNPYDL